MRLPIPFAGFLVSMIVNCSCNKSTTAASDMLVYQSAHFKISYTSYDKDHIGKIADTLEKYYTVFTGRFGTGELATVNVHFYQDVHALQEAVKVQIPNLPLWATGLATSATQIHMISPYHPALNTMQMMSNLVHEFAHCVTLAINPRFGNNPRWLWESMAVYDSNQFRDPRLLPYMVSQNPPSITELNEFNSAKVYEVGFLIGEYIVSQWGYIKLKEFIQNKGQIQASLGMDNSQFINNWLGWVKVKYGI
jgi:hypothetical protein